MPRVLDPFRFVLIAVAGWMNQHKLQIIDYLREENRVLREQLSGGRVRFNDDQRRRLAAKAKGLGRKLLAEVATADQGTHPAQPPLNGTVDVLPRDQQPAFVRVAGLLPYPLVVWIGRAERVV